MSKIYIDTVKYLVYANFEVDGIVDKPDVVGAIFGQTEGLLGEDLDLRDLQKNGRIGRIEVDLTVQKGKTYGVIKIPSSLDMVETSIIAAALETVDRVGPCDAKITSSRVEDTRNEKRRRIIERAKELLKNLLATEIPESREISDMVRLEVKTAEITPYGPEGLPAGPAVQNSDSIILVEGRADVINMLRNDITNVIAIGGAKVPKTIVELSKKKEVTVFLDGDRGGDIILNELLDAGVEIDFVARAPVGREVEELTRKEIIKCLRNKIPSEQETTSPAKPYRKEQVFKQEERQTVREEVREIKEAKEEKKSEEKKKEEKPKKVLRMPTEKDMNFLREELNTLADTLKARFYDEDLALISEVPVRDLIKTLTESEDVFGVVFDGIITQRLADLASEKGVRVLVGLKLGNVNKKPENLEIVVAR
ncbi:MAG: DNA primase DnaG [Candidatus Anstonellales archaeon]